jgi:hypothetical protein
MVNSNPAKIIFLKNDTIYLSARKKVKTDEYGDPIKEEKGTEKPSISFKTDALIEYLDKRKSKHLLIPKFKKLQLFTILKVKM